MTLDFRTPVAPQKLASLDALLRQWGCTLDDFDMEEDRNSDLGQLFGLAGGVLVVRRRESGEERVYAAGMGSGWAAALVSDLSRGLLGSYREPD